MWHKDSRTWGLLRVMCYPIKKDSILVEQAFITKENCYWIAVGFGGFQVVNFIIAYLMDLTANISGS